MSEEISKKEYQTRKADYNLQKSRLQTQLEVKYRGDDGFNATVLNTLKILSKAKDIFTATTRSITDKQLLLHLLFKHIVLQEGIISCSLNQPFSFILSYDVLKSTENDTATKNESCELQKSQGLEADFDGFSEGIKNERFELQILLKNQEVTSENATSVLSGWGGWIRTNECRHQKPMPYHLATPQYYFRPLLNISVKHRIVNNGKNY